MILEVGNLAALSLNPSRSEAAQDMVISRLQLSASRVYNVEADQESYLKIRQENEKVKAV